MNALQAVERIHESIVQQTICLKQHPLDWERSALTETWIRHVHEWSSKYTHLWDTTHTQVARATLEHTWGSRCLFPFLVVDEEEKDKDKEKEEGKETHLPLHVLVYANATSIPQVLAWAKHTRVSWTLWLVWDTHSSALYECAQVFATLGGLPHSHQWSLPFALLWKKQVEWILPIPSSLENNLPSSSGRATTLDVFSVSNALVEALQTYEARRIEYAAALEQMVYRSARLFLPAPAQPVDADTNVCNRVSQWKEYVEHLPLEQDNDVWLVRNAQDTGVDVCVPSHPDLRLLLTPMVLDLCFRCLPYDVAIQGQWSEDGSLHLDDVVGLWNGSEWEWNVATLDVPWGRTRTLRRQWLRAQFPSKMFFG